YGPRSRSSQWRTLRELSSSTAPTLHAGVTSACRAPLLVRDREGREALAFTQLREKLSAIEVDGRRSHGRVVVCAATSSTQFVWDFLSRRVAAHPRQVTQHRPRRALSCAASRCGIESARSTS